MLHVSLQDLTALLTSKSLTISMNQTLESLLRSKDPHIFNG